MSRYVARPRSSRPRADWFDDDSPMIPSLSVDGPGDVDTGLVDLAGNEIWRVPPPIGFGRCEEWD